MTNELVDVWMVTYNHEKYISEAIESVLFQKTDFNVRLIIGEDNSTDQTRRIIARYIEKYPNKISALFNTQNLGPNGNAKQVYDACSAKYMAMLEGDDYWVDDTKLQRQVEYLEANPDLSMCFTDSYIVGENNIVLPKKRVDPKYKRALTQTDILNGFCPPGNTALLKSQYLKEIIKNFPKIINGDFYIFALMANYGLIGYMDFASAAYRMHENGIWAKTEEEHRVINYLKVISELKEKVLPQNKKIISGNITSVCQQLQDANKSDLFLENNMWTPQTAMLRKIRDVVMQIDSDPRRALSIDKNPSLEKIISRKWPRIDIEIASWPRIDAQNLHQHADEAFDIVFSHQVMEHIPKPWVAAKEMNRVLKKGGIGMHTTCAFNPKHGPPAFNDYYRFLPDGLAQLFDGVRIIQKEGWGNKQALIYNLTIDDGHGELGGRRFNEAVGKPNEEKYPWHTWIIYQKI